MLDGATTRFLVVVNHEGQYSVWPEDREPPAGWRAHGTRGTRAECLEVIRTHWDDMRPLSLRSTFEEGGA
ncbi:MbtH domain-containing protein [Streptomyces viridochromogenes DSM 40736]|uniref:MbtH domain-containing protein n=2 Tax=Streptomyces viridochromogenes TaxID=1938 RepID=D9XF50_STRVT|nr:MbtH family protein [Streptomyces viridochromogenes]AAU00076.1 putative PhpA [Streptomyces viridochromogenes]EFL30529.1 MbtH domain-containing protein [Streptomyces viridochromogenes DSM 40736]